MDSFLEQLTQGGFRIEELARMERHGGVEILGANYYYQKLTDGLNQKIQPRQLLQLGFTIGYLGVL